MTQKFAGHVVDEEDFEHEVWVETHNDGTKEHVFVIFGGAEIADFPYNAPQCDCDLSEAAQLVAEGKQKRITLPILLYTGVAE